jgi:hypothetical protein
MDASQIGKRAWSYAGVLQDAGLSCFEYVEQLTLLLFLKMADQLTEEPYNRAPIVPPELGWKALLPLDGAALEDQYRASLEKLGVKPGMLGVIFKGARCEIHNPALLKQLIVNLLDKVDWLSLPVDVRRRKPTQAGLDSKVMFAPDPVEAAFVKHRERHPLAIADAFRQRLRFFKVRQNGSHFAQHKVRVAQFEAKIDVFGDCSRRLG